MDGGFDGQLRSRAAAAGEARDPPGVGLADGEPLTVCDVNDARHPRQFASELRVLREQARPPRSRLRPFDQDAVVDERRLTEALDPRRELVQVHA